jgi:hypothetical protein
MVLTPEIEDPLTTTSSICTGPFMDETFNSVDPECVNAALFAVIDKVPARETEFTSLTSLLLKTTPSTATYDPASRLTTPLVELNESPVAPVCTIDALAFDKLNWSDTARVLTPDIVDPLTTTSSITTGP